MTKELAKKKAKELVSQMTVEEKVSQLLYNSPAIERLGINDGNFSRRLRHELPEDEQQRILQIINDLAAEREEVRKNG